MSIEQNPRTMSLMTTEVRLEHIGRLAIVALGLEREGCYNGAKLVRAALERELLRFADAHVPVGGPGVADAVAAVRRDLGEDSGTLGASRGDAVWRAWGIFYPPGVLPVGPHPLSGFAVFSDGSAWDLDSIPFHIDSCSTSSSMTTTSPRRCSSRCFSRPGAW